MAEDQGQPEGTPEPPRGQEPEGGGRKKSDKRVSLSGPFIRHPIGTTLLMIGVLFAGIVAYPRLPVAPLPQVDFPTIQVSATLPAPAPRPWPRRWHSRWRPSSRRFRG